MKSGLQVLGKVAGQDPAVERLRAMMERQVRQLTCLAGNLIDVSRVSRGLVQLRKERVERAAIVSQAVETTRPVMEERHHTLTVHIPDESVWVDGDPVRLEQILGHLFTNAARYTEPGGRIAVVAEKEGAQAVVRERDTGIGVKPEMLPRIFELFTQADRIPVRVHESLGIGLTLVKSLVGLHGGMVEACSEGGGSRKRVRCPRSGDLGT